MVNASRSPRTLIRKAVRLSLASALLAAGGLCALAAETSRPAVRILQSTDRGLTLEIVSAPRVRLDGGYAEVTIPGFGRLTDPGRPVLPAGSRRIALPVGARPTLRVLEADEAVLLAARPAPFPTITRLDGPALGLGDPRVVRSEDPSIYEGTRRFPDAPVSLGEPGALRGVPFVELRVTPVYYDPVAGIIGHHRRLVVSVEFGGRMPALGSVPTLAADAPFRGSYATSFINPAQALRVAAEGLLVRGRPASGLGSPEELVRVTAESTTASSASTRYKLTVSQDGIYRLDHAWVAANAPDLLSHAPDTYRVMDLGSEIPITVVDQDMDGTFDADATDPDYIEFVGQALTWDILDPDDWQSGDYTDGNVYWLDAVTGAGLRKAARDGSPVNGYTEAADFTDTVRHEIDDFFKNSLPYETDHWYERPGLLARDDDGTQQEEDGTSHVFPVTVPDPSTATTQASIKVRMLGEDTLHRTNIYVNDLIVDGCGDGIAGCGNQGGGCVDWDGFTEYTHGVDNGQVDFCQSTLTGTTNVKVELPLGRSGQPSDSLFVNWIEITYGREFRAVNDALEFSYANTNARFRVQGLSTDQVAVYETTETLTGGNVFDATRITGVSIGGAGPYEATFEISNEISLPATRSFIVAAITAGGTTGDLLPDEVNVHTPSDIMSPSAGADWMVIGDADLMDPSPTSPFQLLVDYRDTTQGKRVRTVSVEEIYDEFSYGIFDPQAIRDFLIHAYTNWPAGPSGEVLSEVILLGDGNFDYKNGYAATSKRIWVPVYMRTLASNTLVGYYPDEMYFARLDGSDELPDIHLGRIPAHSMSEANDVFDKILGYEQLSPGLAWQHNVLLTAENTDNRFKQVSEDARIEFLDGTPHTYNRIYQQDLEPQFPGDPQGLAAEVKDRIQRNLNADPDGTRDIGPGAAVFAFVGHGSWQNWGKNATTFQTKSGTEPDDLVPVTNFDGTRLPFLFISNCLSGGFHITSRPTSTDLTYAFTEDFLTTASKGAVATFAPGHLTFLHNLELEYDEIFGAMYGPRKIRHVGEIAQKLREAFDNNLAVVDLRSFTLIADPATTLVMPAPAAPTNVSITSEGDKQIDLAWTASADASTYRVYRSSTGGSYTLAGTTGGTTFSDSGLTNCTTYFYQVASVDASGFEGPRSHFNTDCPGGTDCLSGVPRKASPPGAPTGVVVTDPETGARLDVSWSANPAGDEVNGYTVRWSETPFDPTPPNSKTLTANFTSAPINGLTEGTTYYVTVSASNCSQGEGPRSAEVFETPRRVRGIKPPKWISDLMVTREPDGDGTDDVRLDWTLPDKDIYDKDETLSEVRVYHDATSPQFPLDPGHLLFNDGAGTATSYVHEDAFGDSSLHHYLVVTVDVDGNRSGGGHELPKGIDDLMVSFAGPGQLLLTWGPITEDLNGLYSPASEYKVYGQDTLFSRAQTPGMAPLDTTSGTSSTLAEPAQNTFFYSVIVVDGRENESPW